MIRKRPTFLGSPCETSPSASYPASRVEQDNGNTASHITKLRNQLSGPGRPLAFPFDVQSTVFVLVFDQRARATGHGLGGSEAKNRHSLSGN
jgi:hypothetical protein